MIATLDGIIIDKNLESIVVDVRGVGYGVYVANEDLAGLEVDSPAKLYIYEHIRESSHDLFGFVNADNKRLFQKLLEVNGVGPKMALNMLSIGSVDRLRTAIAQGDVKFISQASGVGKRVAERVVVDLKDKVGLISSGDATDFLQGADTSDEATQALMGLGFTNAEAARALKDVDSSLTVEDRIKQALKRKN